MNYKSNLFLNDEQQYRYCDSRKQKARQVSRHNLGIFLDGLPNNIKESPDIPTSLAHAQI
jgi:hypothetical protein